MARPRLSVDQKRFRRDVWLNNGEWSAVIAHAKEAGLPTRTYCRRVLLRKHIRPIPELNREAWAELARLAANINQLAHHANASGELGQLVELQAVARQVAALRLQLIGADTDEDEADDRED